jgi:hypothetical protein
VQEKRRRESARIDRTSRPFTRRSDRSASRHIPQSARTSDPGARGTAASSGRHNARVGRRLVTYSLGNCSPRLVGVAELPCPGGRTTPRSVAMSLLQCRMARVVWVYHGASLRGLDGRLYTAHACGRQRADGTWAGWIEFVSLDGAGVLRTPHETTQPALVELINWAGGVTSAHLQAALERAIHAARRLAFTRSPTQSFYDRPSSPEPVGHR